MYVHTEYCTSLRTKIVHTLYIHVVRHYRWF